MRRAAPRVPGLSWRFLVLHLVGALAVLSGESFRSVEPTVEFVPASERAQPLSGPSAWQSQPTAGTGTAPTRVGRCSPGWAADQR